MAVVEKNIPIVAVTEECVENHSQEPRAVLAHGPEEAILTECTVGVVFQTHLKIGMKPSLTPK
jgi:hypothetical protein